MELEQLLSSELLEWVNDAEDEQNVDSLLLAASEQFENDSTHNTPPMNATSTHCAGRFAPPKRSTACSRKAVPKSTKQDTKFCVNIWKEWTKHREQITHTHIGPLIEMTTGEMQHRLSQFISEARKRDGTVYPPNTLHHIVCGLMRHLRWNGRPHIDFFKDPSLLTSDQHLMRK